jgi:hypothetical protein
MERQNCHDVHSGHSLMSSRSGALLLVAKAAVFGGLYDPWAPGGGDVRLVSSSEIVPTGYPSVSCDGLALRGLAVLHHVLAYTVSVAMGYEWSGHHLHVSGPGC